MNRLRIFPLDDSVVFPGMPVTLPVDVGSDEHVLLVPRHDNTYASVGVVAEVSERVRLAGRGLAVSLMAPHRATPGAAAADQEGVLRVDVEARPDHAPATSLTRELEREYRAVVENVLEYRGAGQIAEALRGITDPGSVVLFPWTAGNWGPEDAADRGRLIRLQATVSQGSEDNYYARPLEGLIVTVELDRMTVRIDDYGVVPLPTHSGNYTPAGITDPENVPYFPQGLRTDLKPIEITQPEGVSFQDNGHQVSWQKWRFRVGFTPREGLVLHLVEYFDQGRWRPILYRAALSEMYVPYGDPSPTHNFKNVFDTGEVGIGVLANSLELGCDCLGEIYYFDACVNDPYGDTDR